MASSHLLGHWPEASPVLERVSQIDHKSSSVTQWNICGGDADGQASAEVGNNQI
jgi:hypothetical protein